MKAAAARRALPVLVSLGLAGLWGAALGWSHVEGGLPRSHRLESTMTDLRTLSRGRASLPFDRHRRHSDATVSAQGRYPLAAPRSAASSTAWRRPGPGRALDLLLLDSGPPGEDEALASSLSRAPSVIAAAALFPGGRQWVAAEAGRPLDRIPEAERFLLPLAAFSSAAAIGIVNVATDRSGAPRFVPMLFRTRDRIEAALPLRVASLAAGADPEIEPDRVILGERAIATDLGHVLPLSFYGPRGTIRTVSAGEVLAGETDPGLFRDRIVVIGATVTGGGDVFPSPFDPVLPGVEVVSTAIAHLVSGGGLVRDRSVRLADAAIAVLVAMLLVGLLAWRRSAIGLAAMAAVVTALAAANIAAFSKGICSAPRCRFAAALPPVMLFGAMQLWQNRHPRPAFRQPERPAAARAGAGAREMAGRPRDFLAEPCAWSRRRLHRPVRFTGLSETLGPGATREMLNGFHALVDEEVTACGGIVTSYMGDGSMSLFGLPEPAARDAANAARCCLGLCRRTRAWLDGLPASTAGRLGFKVGAHYGTIVASRLGGEGRQHIAATGDTVNVASRLMEIAAANGAELAISNEMLQVAGSGDLFAPGLLTGPLEAGLRGRSGSLSVWLWRGRTVDLRPQDSTS